MTCPHCTQGYVQDAGFAVCNRCGGTGLDAKRADAASLRLIEEWTGHRRPRRGLSILRDLWAFVLLALAVIYAAL